MVQVAVYFVGEYIFSDMMEPLLTKFFNYYYLFIVLPTPFEGQW
jgi:hypothetical protein